MGTVRVGVSGWSYPRWRGDFYPAGLPQRAELGYCAERMGAIELNGSFYSLQRPSSYRRWAEQAGTACVAVKGGRFVTHMRRLRDVETPLANFFASGVLALGERLGPVLWQLPADLDFDADLLERFCRLLPATAGEAAELARRHDDKAGRREPALTGLGDLPADRPLRHALEPRSATFDRAEARDLLAAHGVACVLADSAGAFPALDLDTSDLRYVRLHGHTELYRGGYGPERLDGWARRCRAWARDHDVVVFFDNDADGRAPFDAVALHERLAGRG